MEIKFRFHAISRMFERSISESDIIHVLNTGIVIEDYPDDQPYPSCLMLGYVGNRPLHLVTAKATDADILVIITVYEPDTERWQLGFKERKSS